MFKPMDVFGRLWNASAPLTIAGMVMIPALLGSILGLLIDPRLITGAPAWLKPAKFAISTSIYCFTLAWIFSKMKSTRLTKLVGWVTGVVLVLEVGVIDLQAGRGVTSHFNVGTALDATLFSIMGVAILILWLAAIAVTVALFRQDFEDPTVGWSLRLGMLIMVFGAGLGGWMTKPTTPQLEAARRTHRMAVSGAHTVGAPDGGPGLAFTGWSTEHGDLRVPHFLGLHAMQILPFLGFLLARARRPPGWIQFAGACYFGLWAFLTWEALQGRPLGS